jgi:diguanylate cyclase (GGDEF)-like protein/PAS domain S-box-containing protein
MDHALEHLPLDILECLLEGVVVHSSTGRIVYANRSACRILRASFETLAQSALDAGEWCLFGADGHLLPAQDWPVAKILNGASSVEGALVGHQARAGEPIIWFTVNATARQVGPERIVVATFVESPTPLGFRFRDVVENSRDIVIVTDAHREPPGPRIVYANPAFSRLTGYSLDEVMGRSPGLLQGPDTEEAPRAEIRRALEAGQEVRTTILNYSKTGRPYWLDIQINPLRDATGAITHFVAFERDMSASHNELERAVHAATHDPLTGVLNRRGLIGLYQPMQARCLRDGGLNALLAIDVDRFKSINDRFGHAEGDRVLKDLAAVIARRLRKSEVFARVGGEEFVILAPVPDLAAATRLAEAIRQLVKSSVTAGDIGEPVTISIGVCVSKGTEQLDALLALADAQLYQAKHAGRDCVMSASPSNP